MTRRARGFCLLIILFSIHFFPSLSMASDQADFYQALGKLVDHATHKRPGIVLWLDLKTKEQKIFGKVELAEQKFRPGSVFKLLTAEAALERFSTTTYHCVGHDKIAGKIRHCWRREGHGWMDLAGAIAWSCNLYFSRLGLLLGAQDFKTELTLYPFLDPLPLMSEEKLQAEMPNLAIGDSPWFRLSPLQMAQFWKAYLAKLGDPHYAVILQGLQRASQEGTASGASPNGIKILAKTGTADSETKQYATDAWLVAAYPDLNPRFALVIFLQEAYGFREPARLAKKIFSLADRNHVLEAGIVKM